MARVGSNRVLTSLFKALTGNTPDTHGATSLEVQPVYIFDDVRRGLGNETTARIYGSMISSAAVGNNSAFTINAPALWGIWIRKLYVLPGNNYNWAYSIADTMGSFPTASDADTQTFNVTLPNGAKFGAFPVGGFTVNSQLVWPSGALPLLGAIQTGRQIGTGTGAFWSGSNQIPMIEDLWIPPSSGIYGVGITQNVAASLYFDLEVPPDALF